jgi:uncharacterized protein
MLGANGFSVVQGVAPTRAALLRALATFSRQTVKHDVALVYCTGHGMESNGSVYLLPGDFRQIGRRLPERLRASAISVDRIAKTCRATKFNLVFFAGCRTLVSDESER